MSEFGWAPILGTSMASRSLYIAQGKGVAVSEMAMARVDTFTRTDGTHLGSGAGGGSAMSSSAGAAGVDLYAGNHRSGKIIASPPFMSSDPGATAISPLRSNF